jgi:uncharacterized C2H2 Zn-finger protein
LRNECTAASSSGDNRKFACPDCDKKFAYVFMVTRHLRNVHKYSNEKAQEKVDAIP